MDSKVEQWRSRVVSLAAKSEEVGETADYIDEAIVLGREALELYPPTHPVRGDSLIWLANHLWDRYKQLEAVVDLDEAIDLEREALELRTPGNADRSDSLISLALHLSTRYERLWKMEDLDEAIALRREALTLCPPGNPYRPGILNSHAGDLCSRYEQLGRMEDLDEAIVLDREALELRPSEDADRCVSWICLASHLFSRYERLGNMKDLDEAIVLGREALTICPPEHRERPAVLTNYAGALATRHKQLGGMEHLDEAIVLTREALEYYLPGDGRRSASLNSLALFLTYRHEQLGALTDFDEAIILAREALGLCPHGHADRSAYLGNLALHLFTRYQQLNAREDLDEAIVLDQEALALRPPGHPDRSTPLGHLAADLYARYKQLGAVEDLHEAIKLAREALMLRPPGHPNRPASLINLATNLFTRYEKLGAVEDLNEAIVLDREALALQPSGHPGRSKALDSLGDHLSARSNQSGAINDLDEAILIYRDALALRPPGHPDRPSSLNNLAVSLSTQSRKLGQLTDGEEILSVYAELAHVPQLMSSSDLSAANAWVDAAEDFHHPTTLLAYETALRSLIQHMTTLPSPLQHLNVLEQHASLGVNAFSAGLRYQSPARAVEFLEQGRGLIWNQFTRLRSPLNDVTASGPEGKTLAEKFAQLASAIRHALDSTDVDRRDRTYHLNIELQTVVTCIRNLPGLSRFLLPSPFSGLQQAASEGPVVIVNASKYGCDALVVLSDRDPVHIPLQITKQHAKELSSKFHTLAVCATRANIAGDLVCSLRELWDEVVSPIAEFLQTVYSRQSRIWWCPTAEFSPLPLHAAGPYREGEQNFSDLYISSYTPTLTALIRARRPSLSNSTAEQKRFVAISRSAGAGESELHSVGTDLANIGKHVKDLTTFTCVDGTECNIVRVGEELCKNEWVHLACPGLPNWQQPLESAFALHDRYLTIQRLIQYELDDPQFAYLSAGHTALADEKHADEAIHLASAMLFAGFRSVIGTMWEVNEDETNEIVSMFYDNMVDEEGRLDHTRAALALRETMRCLVDLPLYQRISYIHLGA